MKDDLISIQAAVDRINKQREHLQPDIYPQDKIGDAAYRICAEFIGRLPSAIIRCKECKHWRNGHICMAWSRHGKIETKGDDFCSYGCRKGDNDD